MLTITTRVAGDRAYIAAHALELGVPLLTANPKDFNRISHLVTILPWT